jgi:hypothetical protein
MAAFAQSFEELARLFELLCPRSLGEVAADDDQVGLELVHLRVNGLDQLVVVRSEMEVGQVDDASHVDSTTSA